MPRPPGEACVLEGSSSKLARSIGNHPDVLAPFGTLLEDEPLEVGQRLRDREAPGCGLQLGAEEIE